MLLCCMIHPLLCVALRKESVDRNVNLRVVDGSKSVALRKESVDRNTFEEVENYEEQTSLSARRAWIEILHTSHDFPAPKVALRKESVDRNVLRKITITVDEGSLSARRAWIEIAAPACAPSANGGRSPQGERG